MQDFAKIIDTLSKEVDSLGRSFKVFRTLNESTNKRKILEHPNFWRSVFEALFNNFFIDFGRVFEQRNNKNLSIYWVLEYCKEHIQEFSKEALQNRKPQHPEYAKDAYELSSEDIEIFNNILSQKNDCIGKLRRHRHTKVAHRSIEELLKEENIGVRYSTAWGLFCLTKRITYAIWEAYYNGNKIDITDPDLNINAIFKSEYDDDTRRFLSEI